MQIRCHHCHRPFAIGKAAVNAALVSITEKDLNHYNAHCPHCRRANRISQQALLHAAPGWTYEESGEQAKTE